MSGTEYTEHAPQYDGMTRAEIRRAQRQERRIRSINRTNANRNGTGHTINAPLSLIQKLKTERRKANA